MANNTDRLSFAVSSVLDSMGFSRHRLDFRVNNIMYGDEIGAFGKKNTCVFESGGQADGTSQLGQGDIDLMLILRLTIASGRHIDQISPQHTVLYTEDTGVHHGYTLLRVSHKGEMSNIIIQSLVKANSALYVSSFVLNQIMMQGLMQRNSSEVQFQPISGPSHPALISGRDHIDYVTAFIHPDWPIQASQWMDRCRINGWPPESIIMTIVKSGCHIVPKGFKGSCSEHMEWCFSFAVQETSIIGLFNLTQKHVYYLLKKIAKDLRERSPDLQDLLTSYTMKTVVLWQVELHHTKDWDRYHLLDRLIDALDFLKSCVENQNLPAYFITENNLFDGKINVYKASVLSHQLIDLLSQGIECIFSFSFIQQQLQISQIPGLRQSLAKYRSGYEMGHIINKRCEIHLCADLYITETRRILSLIHSPNVSRRGLFTKMMKVIFAYLTIAKIKMMGMSNRIKYQSYRYLLHFVSANIDTDRMSGRVKFASVLHVLGNTNRAIESLCDIKQQSPFGICAKCHVRNIISKDFYSKKTNSDNCEAVITKLGRYRYIQQCLSLDVRYTIEEICIVPNVIKYELFHFPELIHCRSGAFVDPEMLRNYLLYKCYAKLRNESNARAAFINLIRIATQDRFNPYIEYREVALNVLGLCYLEKKDYLRAYICFCRAMSLRPRLLKVEWSTSAPWHLAVLLSKLINR
ncbi:hypothetical protein ACJMK2_031839 [Sinanodonta woodiana]|uniref:Mab-21-like HhH/H2TH-like domain-containing protein n=1 Tax=Sinanodonta woodiana TaxID=1069815 RepID=A0ABD3X012_SINWO